MTGELFDEMQDHPAPIQSDGGQAVEVGHAREDLAASATGALEFIRGRLWRDGRLLATAMEGRAHLNAYLDDYVYLADALLELQQVRFRAAELAFARELIEVVPPASERHWNIAGSGCAASRPSRLSICRLF